MNTITIEADFNPHLKLQKLTDRLDVSEKKLKEYEDLFAMLYHNACEHCRESFPRNGLTGVAASMESSPAAQPLGPIVKPSPPSGGSDPPGSSSFTESLWYRIFKISVLALLSGRHGREISAAETRSDHGTPTDSSGSSVPLWYRILNFSFGRFFFGGRGQTTSSRVTAPEIESSQGGASRHGVSTELETFAGPSNVSHFPPEDEYGHFTTESHVRTVTKLTLEHVWIHGGWTTLTSVKFSPDGKSLAVGLLDHVEFGAQKTHIYDITSGGNICLLYEPYIGEHHSNPRPNYVSFSPDGRYLAMGNLYGGTTIWDVGKRRVRNPLISRRLMWRIIIDDVSSEGHYMFAPSFPSSVVFSPNGRYVASSSEFDSRVCIWSMRDGSVNFLQCEDNDDYGDDNGDGDGDGDDAGEERLRSVWDAKFSPDGKHVVASTSRFLHLWSVRTLKLVKKWKPNQGIVSCIAFMPNGRGLVTAGSDHTLKYWDLGNSGVEFWEFFGHYDAISSVAVSPNGRWIFCGSNEGTVYIWDMVDASLQCRLLGHKYKIRSVDFSPTGDYVACGSQSGMTSLWRLESAGISV